MLPQFLPNDIEAVKTGVFVLQRVGSGAVRNNRALKPELRSGLQFSHGHAALLCQSQSEIVQFQVGRAVHCAPESVEAKINLGCKSQR